MSGTDPGFARLFDILADLRDSGLRRVTGSMSTRGGRYFPQQLRRAILRALFLEQWRKGRDGCSDDQHGRLQTAKHDQNGIRV